MATKPANAKQKQWMSDVAEWANNSGIDLIYDFECEKGIQLHHVLGRSYRKNKVAIGHWFVIPVPFELHDVNSGHIDNVTHYKHRFTDRFGNQRDLFQDMVNDMRMDMYELPPVEVIDAIMETKS